MIVDLYNPWHKKKKQKQKQKIYGDIRQYIHLQKGLKTKPMITIIIKVIMILVVVGVLLIIIVKY